MEIHKHCTASLQVKTDYFEFTVLSVIPPPRPAPTSLGCSGSQQAGPRGGRVVRLEFQVLVQAWSATGLPVTLGTERPPTPLLAELCQEILACLFNSPTTGVFMAQLPRKWDLPSSKSFLVYGCY